MHLLLPWIWSFPVGGARHQIYQIDKMHVFERTTRRASPSPTVKGVALAWLAPKNLMTHSSWHLNYTHKTASSRQLI